MSSSRILVAGVLPGATLVLAPVAASAVTLFDNGPAWIDARAYCTSNNCGSGTRNWTYLDDFEVAARSTLTSFEFIDGIVRSEEYLGTNWSIFAGDPFVNAPIASGHAVATLSSPLGNQRYRLEVTGLDVPLEPGIRYWLGTNNQFADFGYSFVVPVDGSSTLPGGARADDGGGNQLLDQLDRAFRVSGVVVPEPSTGLLLALGSCALGLRARPGRRARPASRLSGRNVSAGGR